MSFRSLKVAVAAGIAALAAFVAVPERANAAQGTGCMPVTGTISGLQFSNDVTAAIAALISSNSGAIAPATDCSGAPVAGQLWLDTSSAPNAVRQYDGAVWLVIGYLDATNHLFLPSLGGGLVAVTAATTTDICANKSTYQTITGGATITSFGSSCSVGQMRLLLVSGTPTFGNTTNLLLPAGGNNIVAQNGDRLLAVYAGGGIWHVTNYQRVDGTPLALSATGVSPGTYSAATVTVGADGRVTSIAAHQAPQWSYLTANGTYTTPAGATRLILRVLLAGGGGGGGSGSGFTFGSSGGNSGFGGFVAIGGGGGSAASNSFGAAGGAGGTAGTGAARHVAGQAGGSGGSNEGAVGTGAAGVVSGSGGNSCLSGGGAPNPTLSTQSAAPSNQGGGGAGAISGSISFGGGGGGGAGECWQGIVITSPASSYAVTIGAAGAAGTGSAGTGGAGGSGYIEVEAQFD